VAGHRVDDDVRERERAVGGCCLGRPEERTAVGEQDELLLDPEAVVVEVEVVGVEAEALALAHPGSGGENDQCAVALGDGVGQGVHGGRGERVDLDGKPLRELGALAG
jgi:hypothetical protein